MRPVLLDTNAYTAFKLNNKDVIDTIQHATTIGISSIVMGELLGGFACSSKPQQNREELHQFISSPRVQMYSVTIDTAKFYSQIYEALRKKGKPIPTNDLWIAAQAIEHGCLLCTFDGHFSFIDGLITGCKLFDFI